MAMRSFSKLTKISAGLIALASAVGAEQHTIIFDNRCAFGSSALLQNGQVIFGSTGPVHEFDAYTINNSLTNFTAFLSTGDCNAVQNPTGTGCTVVTGTLALPERGGSSVQVSATPDGGIPTAFFYNGGSAPGCWDGLSSFPGTTSSPLACAAPDVNLAITFCH